MVRSQKQNEYIFNNITTFFLFILKDIELWFILAQFQASKIQYSLPKIMIFFFEGTKCVLEDLFHHVSSNQAQNNKKKLGFLTYISNNINIKV